MLVDSNFQPFLLLRPIINKKRRQRIEEMSFMHHQSILKNFISLLMLLISIQSELPAHSSNSNSIFRTLKNIELLWLYFSFLFDNIRYCKEYFNLIYFIFNIFLFFSIHNDDIKCGPHEQELIEARWLKFASLILSLSVGELKTPATADENIKGLIFAHQ